jgi:hypothetical protein
MKRTVRVLLAVSMLGLSAVATSGSSALADVPRTGYSVFAYGEYPVAAGRDVTAVAVYLVNSRFRHRRVAGPGVVWTRNPYWW